MRLGSEWMVFADDRIMECLREDGPKQPSEMADDDRFHWSRKHIGDRCRKLVKYGLLERYGRGVYAITSDGEAYLDGELNADSLELEDG